jgi:hypothetical protein
MHPRQLRSRPSRARSHCQSPPAGLRQIDLPSQKKEEEEEEEEVEEFN